MNWGSLRDLFTGIAWKRLSAHEVDPAVSNGHEFQGARELRALLGAEPLLDLPATYLLFGDDDGAPECVRATASWYDARARDPNRSQEWRLYYPREARAIQARMHPGDLVVIARFGTGSLAVLLAPQGSVREAQLSALFGLDLGDAGKAHIQHFAKRDSISFVAVTILEDLGLAAPEPVSGTTTDTAAQIAHELVGAYGSQLPTGVAVAELIQQRMPGEDAVADPDGALHRWIEAQAAVYRLWEDEIIRRRIQRGFLNPPGVPDVQAFRDFTMSLRQSRVSRAGAALQLHTARILRANRVRFDEQVITENNERPDFVFPGAAAYHDAAFPAARLHMLAAKFTLKDRWRQVLNEAARIRHKHLLTMDGAVTASGLTAMAASHLELVIPDIIRSAYPAKQRSGISSVREFIALLLERQITDAAVPL